MQPPDAVADESEAVEEWKQAFLQFGLTDRHLEEISACGLSEGEISEACHLFRIRVASGTSDCGEALTIEDVDVLLRQLRLFMSVRFLWALFHEIDENVNGKVELNEFIWMVAKLRGRSSMSREFYLRSLPRAVKERFCKVFDILSDDGMMQRDDLTTACRQLNPHVDTDNEEFRRTLEDTLQDANASKTKFSLDDFLVLQAKLRKAPPEIDVALLSLTDSEFQRFSGVYGQWKQVGSAMSSPQELRSVLNQLGHPMPLEQVRRLMQNTELDGTRAIELREFLYVLVQLGAGTNDRPRSILRPGASYEEAFNMEISLEDLWELDYEDLVQIRRAGWSAHAVIKAGLGEAWQLRQVGYGADDLRKIGWSAKKLKLAGFSLEELRNAGFSSESLRECVSVLSKHRAHRANEESALTLRPSSEGQIGLAQGPPGSYFEGGGPCGELRWWATPRIKAMLDGPPGFGGLPGPKKSNVRARPTTS